MEISSADLTKMTIQEVADLILDQDCNGVSAFGKVNDVLYKLTVTLEVEE